MGKNAPINKVDKQIIFIDKSEYAKEKLFHSGKPCVRTLQFVFVYIKNYKIYSGFILVL